MVVGVERRLITTEEFEHLIETGFFGPDERVELVNGELIRMAPIGDSHGGQVNRLNRRLGSVFSASSIVSIQNPVALARIGRPQPDVMLLRQRADDYSRSTPTAADVLLLIEVSDTTLVYDRDTKGPMYAAAGIADYWILDLADRQLLVYREPRPAGYASVQILVSGDSIAPLAFSDVTIAVSDLLIEA